MLSLPFQAREAAFPGHFLRISQKSPPGTPFLGGKRPAIWYNGNQRVTPMREQYDGRLLIEARRRLGLSQAEMADAMGIHRSYACKIEHGEREFTPALQRRADEVEQELNAMFLTKC